MTGGHRGSPMHRYDPTWILGVGGGDLGCLSCPVEVAKSGWVGEVVGELPKLEARTCSGWPWRSWSLSVNGPVRIGCARRTLRWISRPPSDR